MVANRTALEHIVATRWPHCYELELLKPFPLCWESSLVLTAEELHNMCLEALLEIHIWRICQHKNKSKNP